VIAADTSTWIAFFSGEEGEDVERLDDALHDRLAMMPPAVLAELLSDPKISADLEATLCEVPLLDISAGYWGRAGRLRATVLAKRKKARLGDALIAQSCLDHRLPLITRDRDVMAFADAAGLDLVIGI
jgi:predicted nucleic acid-binding protein